VFTCCVSASLLLWHWGYQQGWPPAATWCLSYLLAALAGLAKGPQGPIYFVAPTAAYYSLRRDWRYLFSPLAPVRSRGIRGAVGHLANPVRALDRLAQRARHLGGQRGGAIWRRAALQPGQHLLVYPLELLGCLLPWSLPLLYLANPRFWRSLSDVRPWILFSLVAIGVCFPSVWFAAGAKGRYFMPLFLVSQS